MATDCLAIAIVSALAKHNDSILVSLSMSAIQSAYYFPVDAGLIFERKPLWSRQRRFSPTPHFILSRQRVPE